MQNQSAQSAYSVVEIALRSVLLARNVCSQLWPWTTALFIHSQSAGSFRHGMRSQRCPRTLPRGHEMLPNWLEPSLSNDRLTFTVKSRVLWDTSPQCLMQHESAKSSLRRDLQCYIQIQYLTTSTSLVVTAIILKLSSVIIYIVHNYR